MSSRQHGAALEVDGLQGTTGGRPGARTVRCRWCVMYCFVLGGRRGGSPAKNLNPKSRLESPRLQTAPAKPKWRKTRSAQATGSYRDEGGAMPLIFKHKDKSNLRCAAAGHEADGGPQKPDGFASFLHCPAPLCSLLSPFGIMGRAQSKPSCPRFTAILMPGDQ